MAHDKSRRRCGQQRLWPILDAGQEIATSKPASKGKDDDGQYQLLLAWLALSACFPTTARYSSIWRTSLACSPSGASSRYFFNASAAPAGAVTFPFSPG